MVDLLDSGQFQARVHDLVDVVDLDQMTRGREFDRSDLLWTQSILLTVLLDEDLALIL